MKRPTSGISVDAPNGLSKTGAAFGEGLVREGNGINTPFLV